MIGKKQVLHILGPGILFAGAAIGTSHLVQSSRAGAMFGLGLIAVVVFANVIKYPFFRFGPLYTAATGNSILHGYRALGRWVVALLIVTELPVNIIIIAATAVVTSGIALYVFNVNIAVTHLACILIVLAVGLIGLGGYKFVDQCIKWFVAALTVCTFAATAYSFPLVDWSLENFYLPDIDAKTLAFLLALIGFMPAGASLAILHSIWSVEKSRVLGRQISRSEAIFDLNVGYIGSVVLALCFLIMGAGVLHEQGVPLSPSPSAFSGQIISLYSQTLGPWAGWIVGISVFAVMLSTLLTTIDGFARMQREAMVQMAVKPYSVNDVPHNGRVHLLFMAVLGLGAMVVLLNFMVSFKSFIDFVTITAFIIGPVIAILNHVVMHGDTVPKAAKPHKFMTAWSVIGILFLLTLSAAYLLT